MPDDVVVGIGADAKRAEAEFDKMNSIIAKQGKEIKKLSDASTKGAKDGANAFNEMALKIAGITSVTVLATNALNAMLEKSKQIRDLQDSVSLRSEKNLIPAFKEFKAIKREDQQKIENKSQELQRETGLNQETVAGIIGDLGQNKEKLADLLSGKFDEIFKLAAETGADPKQLVATVKASFTKENNLDPTKQQITERSQLFATVGKDVGEIPKLIAKLNGKTTIEEGIALFNAGKDKYGDAGLKEVFSKLKGGESKNQLAKQFNLSPEKFKSDVEELKNKEKNRIDAEGKLNIERGSLSFKDNLIDVEEQRQYGNVETTNDQRKRINRLYGSKTDKDRAFGGTAETFFESIAKIFTSDERTIGNIARSDAEVNKKDFVFTKFLEGQTIESAIKSYDKAISKSEDNKVKTK